jgi:P22_AR N-terminal domain
VPSIFDGGSLDVTRRPDGDVGVTLRRLCEIVGVTFPSQLNRLRRASELGARWATVFMMNTVGADHAMIVIPRRSIPMWAATLNASRCAPGVQPKLVAFQDEAADVLAAAFMPDNLPLTERLEKALALLADFYAQLSERLAHIEKHRALGARTLLLSPQIDPEGAGYSIVEQVEVEGERFNRLAPPTLAQSAFSRWGCLVDRSLALLGQGSPQGVTQARTPVSAPGCILPLRQELAWVAGLAEPRAPEPG